MQESLLGICPTTAPPSQVAKASVSAKLPQHFFIHPPTLSALQCSQNKHLGQAGSLSSVASWNIGIFSAGTDPDAAEAEPQVKPKLQKVCECWRWKQEVSGAGGSSHCQGGMDQRISPTAPVQQNHPKSCEELHCCESPSTHDEHRAGKNPKAS